MVELTTCDSNQLIPSIAIKIEAPGKDKLIHLNFYFLPGGNVCHALVVGSTGRGAEVSLLGIQAAAQV